MKNAWKMHGRCMEDAWKMHGRCMEDAWKMNGRCMEDAWRKVVVGVSNMNSLDNIILKIN